MKILFDHGTPRPLRDHLTEYRIDTAVENGWSELSNGDLLDHAERESYDLLVTTDQNLKFQQNLKSRRLAVLVLRSSRWPRIRLKIADIRDALDAIGPGDYLEVPI